MSIKTCGKCGFEGHNARTCKHPGFPLSRLIESKGFTLAQAADGITFSRGAFQQVCRGSSTMSTEALGRLAVLLGVPQSEVHAAYTAVRKLWLAKELKGMGKPR